MREGEAVESAVLHPGCGKDLRLLWNYDRVEVWIFTWISNVSENPGTGDSTVEEPLARDRERVSDILNYVAMVEDVAVGSARGCAAGQVDEMVGRVNAADALPRYVPLFEDGNLDISLKVRRPGCLAARIAHSGGVVFPGNGYGVAGVVVEPVVVPSHIPGNAVISSKRTGGR